MDGQVCEQKKFSDDFSMKPGDRLKVSANTTTDCLSSIATVTVVDLGVSKGGFSPKPSQKKSAPQLCNSARCACTAFEHDLMISISQLQTIGSAFLIKIST